MTVGDIRWLAGLLEGEGCFGRYRAYGQHVYVNKIALKMADRDVVQHAADVMGWKRPLRVRRDSRRRHYSDLHVLVISGPLAISWMMTLLPLMHERRATRIRQVIVDWRENADRTSPEAEAA